MKTLKITGLLVVLGILLMALTPSKAKENKTKEEKRSWTFCCTDKSHQTLRNSACVVTSQRYKDYKSCYKRVKSHKRAYKKHSCGCR